MKKNINFNFDKMSSIQLKESTQNSRETKKIFNKEFCWQRMNNSNEIRIGQVPTKKSLKEFIHFRNL